MIPTILQEELTKHEVNFFLQVLAIPSARVPIVKCVDSISGISCDLSFKNKNAVHNSAFIRDILGVHEFILLFTTVIRYWALRQRLAGGGVGGGGLTINNYALTMLVIFFLQSENVLPPIRNLQKDISEDDKIEINGWQFGYSLQVIKKSKDQTETIFAG